MQQADTKAVQDVAWLRGKGDTLGIVHKIKIWLSYQMVNAQTRIRIKEGNALNSQGFWDTNGLPNLSLKTRPSID